MPGALANVGGLGGGEADFHFLRLAPDHAEGGFLELFEVEVGRDFKSPAGESRRLNALDGEGSQGVFPVVVADQVQAVVDVPKLVWINLALDGLFVVHRPMQDPHGEPLEDGAGQYFNDLLRVAVVLQSET